MSALIILMKKNILLVDDDKDFIDLYSQVLSSDFNVFSAMNLNECLAFLKTNPFLIDLILCDIFMPESNGFEIFDYLRSKKEYSFYPIVFKTSSLNDDVVNKCMLGNEAELISTLMSNQEIIVRIKKEINKSNLVKVSVDNKMFILLCSETGTLIYPNSVFQLYFTKTESSILKILTSANNIVEKDRIISELYGDNYIITDNNFNTVLSGIRKKIVSFGITVKSIRGKGVVLCRL